MKVWPFLGVAAGLAGTQLLRFIETTRRTTLTPSTSGSILLRYGLGFRILWTAGLAFCLSLSFLIAYVIPMNTWPDRVLSLTLVMLPLTVCTFFYTAEAFRRVFAVSQQGIQTRSPFGAELFLSWADVTQVEYSALNAWLLLMGSNGQRIRVSRYIDGIGSLLDVMDEHLPAAAKGQAATTIRLVRRLTSA